MKNISLTKGQALVLVGPQGSGKTTIARAIAAQYGPYVEVSALSINTHSGLSAALQTEPNTIIIEGWPTPETALEEIKKMLGSEKTMCNPKFKEPRLVKSPLVIICSQVEGSLFIEQNDRRFWAVNVEARP
jgi:energy-coupling factor transporter ATP-binding protein EcfA2